MRHFWISWCKQGKASWAGLCMAVICLSQLPLLAIANGASSNMIFRALSQTDGLSQNTVNDIYQDSRGLIWLATESGLNRYDGVEFTQYQRDPSDAASLPANFVWAIDEDQSGDLWLATRGAGLVRWTRASNRFDQPLESNKQNLAAPHQARSLLIDQQGSIWLGTSNAGLLHLDHTGQLLHWHAKPQQGDPPTGSINAIIQSGNAGLLVLTDKGVFTLNENHQSLKKMAVNWPGQTETPAISSALPDSDGGLWLGSFSAGLLHRAANGTTHHYQPQEDVANSLSGRDVRQLLRDQQGRLWIATQSGLNLYRPDSNDFLSYRHRDSDPYSLSDDHLMSLAQDATGLLWVGSRVGGANIWNPRSWALGAQSPASLAGSVVLSFATADSGNSYWVGGFGAPLQKFDTQGRPLATFDPAHGYPDRGDSPVTSLLRSDDGRLWIGSFDHGLQVYSARDQSLQSLRHQPQQRSSLGADGIMSLMQARDKTIWVGSFGGGVASVQPDSLQVERIADPRLAGIRATALVQDAHDQIWIGSDGNGLYRYQPDSEQLSHFVGSDTPTGPASDTVYALHVDNSGQLWIGNADGGLQYIAAAQLQAEQPAIQRPALSKALPSQTVNGIRQDGSGRLWISTSRGLVLLDPQSGSLREFHRAQGLQSEELNFGAHYRDAEGYMYFGGNGGYNRFHPDDLDNELSPPHVIITAFEKFNRPVRGTAPSDLHAVTLKHDDTVFSFAYALADYTAPRKNRYSVMLQGFDRDWSPPSSHARSTYTNLDPGDYLFRVRGVNSDGRWTEQSRDIAIHVRTAPWAEPWALAAYFIAGLLSLQLLYRWRIRVVQREARIEQLAFYDDITGLPNHDLFVQRCQDDLQENEQQNGKICLLVLQIGPLKHLHDSLGYHSSHDVFRSLGARITQAVLGDGSSSASREVARLSEDSFVVMLHLTTPESEAMRWASQLLEIIQRPLEFGEHKVKLPAQVGIACCGEHGEDAESLLEHARTAAHEHSDGSSGHISFYDQAMTHRARNRLTLESDLRTALRENQLQLYLQGKFNLEGELVGAEALSRWTHPQRGAVSPAVFVPLAEESELVMDLDDWVIDQACAYLDRWHHAGLQGVNIAVNISAETFVSGRIFQALERNWKRYALAPSQLEIEVTESVLASDLDIITNTLNRLKAMGHTLSLDDFGTGYSSLTYLQQFPIDKLKIDQAFVRDLENQPEQLSLCKAIVALARSLHLKTIAEGVENQAQMDILGQLGCDQLQGFFLHRPQDVTSFQAELLSGSVPKKSS